MDLAVTIALVTVFALAFDFTNGFHDTANAMATSVATGALRPRVAVALSAVLNLAGAFLSTEVAKTISDGIIRTNQDGQEQITPALIFAGLVGALLWNVTTWYFGLPSSSTHALLGGLIGAALLGSGLGAVDFGVVLSSVVIPAVLAPVIAGFAAGLGVLVAFRLTRRVQVAGSDRSFKIAQTVSASLVSLAHGTSDAQKTMGVITLTLVAANLQAGGSAPQWWVVLACGLALAAGTYFGGWRIMRTVGTRITPVSPPQGFAAETASAATILASSSLGFALSTTQVVSGAVVGVGVAKRGSPVHWNVAGRIGLAWIVTLPAAALVGAAAALLAGLGPVGLAIVALLAAVAVGAVFVLARRSRVTPDNVRDQADEPAREQEAVR